MDKTVLLLEDDDDLAETIRGRITDKGYVVTIARRLDLARIRFDSFNAIVFNLSVPPLTLSRLVEREGLHLAKTVIYTGHIYLYSRDYLPSLGAKYVVEKGVGDIDADLERISSALDEICWQPDKAGSRTDECTDN